MPHRYSCFEAKTTYGRIGVKVWIYKGDMTEREFEEQQAQQGNNRQGRRGDRRPRRGQRNAAPQQNAAAELRPLLRHLPQRKRSELRNAYPKREPSIVSSTVRSAVACPRAATRSLSAISVFRLLLGLC